MREVVLEAGGLLRGSTAPTLDTFLQRQPGIHHAEANYLSDTVTVGYDEARITRAEIERLIAECDLHCRGEVVPSHICAPGPGVAAAHRPPVLELPDAHAAHPAAAAEMTQLAHEMGHGAGMSMEEMVRDMRRRFWVTFILGLVVTLYSPLGTELLGLRLQAPFGLSNEVLMFLLATPAVLWGGQMFFMGAYRALKRGTLDMSVLVALSVGAGYLFSVATTFLFRGEVFYEAAVVLLILFKNATALEQASKVRAIIFDKTGTLTLGQPQVVEVATSDGAMPETELLALVASAEQGSEHPIAQAIGAYAKARNIPLAPVTGFEAIAGDGLRGAVRGRTVLGGNRKLMRDHGVELGPLAERGEALQGAGRTIVYSALDRHQPAAPVPATSGAPAPPLVAGHAQHLPS